MRMVVPAIIIHPCTLFRDGLCQILTGTRFKPVHMAAAVDETAIERMSSTKTTLWLLGLERCNERTFQFILQLSAGTSNQKAVILAQIQTIEDVSLAIKAGASGFLCQDISRERLITALELIVLGDVVVPAPYLHAITARMERPVRLPSGAEEVACVNGTANGTKHSFDQSAVKGFSKRQRTVLRLVVQGDSNKLIARQLLIAEATVKVHVRTILRKLKLHNRTQAAIWASNHLGVDLANKQGS